MSDPRADWNLVADFAIEDVEKFALGAIYADSTWATVGLGPDGVCVASASSADGPWSLSEFIDLPEQTSIAYGGGYWVIGGGTATATDPAGPWTVNTSPTGGAAAAYGDGQWGSILRGQIFSATDPSGAWSAQADLTPVGSDVSTGSVIAYLDGEWVAMISGDDAVGRIFSTDDVTGSWTERANLTDDDFLFPVRITKTDDGYFLHVGTGVWTASSLDGPWTFRQVFSVDWIEYGDGTYLWVKAAKAYATDTLAGTLEEVFSETDSLAKGAGYANDEWVLVGVYGDSARGAIWAATDGGDGWGLLL